MAAESEASLNLRICLQLRLDPSSTYGIEVLGPKFHFFKNKILMIFFSSFRWGLKCFLFVKKFQAQNFLNIKLNWWWFGVRYMVVFWNMFQVFFFFFLFHVLVQACTWYKWSFFIGCLMPVWAMVGRENHVYFGTKHT